MNQWKEGILEELAVFQRGHDLPKSEMKCGVIPVAGSNGIIGYHNTATTKGPGITIGRSGNIGTPHFYKTDFWAHNTVLYVKDFKGNDESYVFYFLHTFDFAGFNAGSAVPTLNRNHIHELSIKIPPLPEQKAIAGVLSSLDDKIDLLHRQNNTLEAMAEALFRQWFVVEADEGWQEKPISEFVSVVDNRGKTPPYREENTPYPVIEVNALGKSNRLVDYSVIKKFVEEETFNNWFRDKLSKYDTLISTVGSIGAISMYVIEKGNIAQNVIGLHAENISSFFLYQFMKYKVNEILQYDIGGVQPSIKVPHLLSILIQIPSKEKQDQFDVFMYDTLKKMEINYLQIQTIEKLRDTLLPKLMSGEVRVAV